MGEKRDKINNCCLVALIIFITLLFFYAYYAKYEPMYFNNESTDSLNDEWEYYSQSGVNGVTNLPIKLDGEKDKRITFTKILPDDLPTPAVICFRSMHQKVKVNLDGKEIYSFGHKEEERAFGKSSGSAWIMVRLPDKSHGKAISIELISPYKIYSYSMSNVEVGSKASLLFYVFLNNLPALLSGTLIGLLGLILIIAYFIMIKKIGKFKVMLYLGLFAFIVAVWMFGETRLIQFFIKNILVSLLMTIVSMLLVPITILKYIGCIENFGYPKIIRSMITLSYIQLVVVLLLQILNILDFMEMLPYMHVILIAESITLLLLLLLDYFVKKNKHAKLDVWCILILFIVCLIEIVNYYINKGTLIGNYFRLGVLLFIVLQAIRAVSAVIEIWHRSSRAEYFEVIANKDALTQCFNRRAYEDYLNSLSGSLVGMSAVVIDVNDLKRINDTCGHEKGDEAIILCSKWMNHIMGKHGRCYRIGGDEFVFIGFCQSEQNIHQLVKKFEKEYSDIRLRGMDRNLNAACGYAVYDSKKDDSADDIIRRADVNMYERKNMYKVLHAISANKD